MTVDTLSLSRNVLESDERQVLAAREERHTVIETEAAARTEIRAIESATDFVAATTFEEAFLIVVQNGMRSDAALELQSVGRTDDGLDLQITVDNPLLPDHDDLTTHSLLVRVTDEKWRVPGDIAVAIEGYR
ncbi:hypothetical protein BBD46_13075 [Natrialba sp. SSL1]|nr:hypothetical protein BBD46_13075 [Natrialba sp. SSL1]